MGLPLFDAEFPARVINSQLSPGCPARIMGNSEVISSPVGLVPTNALVLTGLATFRVVGSTEITFPLRLASGSDNR